MRKTLIAAVAAVALSGCTQDYNDKRGWGDAPVGDRDDSPADVINFPDLFMNVAFKCHGPNGIYAHTREAAPIIIKDDGNCKGVEG